MVLGITGISDGLDGASDLLELAAEEADEDTMQAVIKDLGTFERDVAALEFRRMSARSAAR